MLPYKEAVVSLYEMYKRLTVILNAFFGCSALANQQLKNNYAFTFEAVTNLIGRSDMADIKKNYFKLFEFLPGDALNSQEEWESGKGSAFDFLAYLEKQILLNSMSQTKTPKDILDFLEKIDLAVKNYKTRYDQINKESAKYRNRIDLETSMVNFNKNTGVLKIGSSAIQFPMNKNEYCLLRYLTDNPGKAVSWDVIYKEMTEIEEPSKEKWRTVYDTVLAINKRTLNLNLNDKLIVWNEKTVRLNK